MDNVTLITHHEQAAAESFERCDTDGFLSQWGHGVMAQKYRIQARIDEAGGVSEFPALFNLQGQRVAAKLIDGKYGPCWAILRPDGGFACFVSAFPKRATTMERKGFVEGKESAPAVAALRGEHVTTVHAVAVRTDRGYPANAIFVE